jgi:hypothetical protein
MPRTGRAERQASVISSASSPASIAGSRTSAAGKSLQCGSATLQRTLTELARRLDIRDGAGRLVDLQRTHRFRHTRATS